MQNQQSRRDFLRYMSVLGLATLWSVPLHAKTTQLIVKYQQTPNNGNSCKACFHFIPEKNECRVVEGDISPNGWCTIFYKNPNYKEGGDTNEINQSNPIKQTV
jgi:hypothetical protein